jgi:hypothetical protein
MKKLLILSSMILSANTFAGQILDCNSKLNNNTYEMAVSDGNKKLRLTQTFADQSTLHLGESSLKFNEGESSPENTLYEGQNDNGNKIAVILYAGTTTFISKSEVIVAKIYYTDKNPNFMSGKATLNCSLR